MGTAKAFWNLERLRKHRKYKISPSRERLILPSPIYETRRFFADKLHASSSSSSGAQPCWEQPVALDAASESSRCRITAGVIHLPESPWPSSPSPTPAFAIWNQIKLLHTNVQNPAGRPWKLNIPDLIVGADHGWSLWKNLSALPPTPVALRQHQSLTNKKILLKLQSIMNYLPNRTCTKRLMHCFRQARSAVCTHLMADLLCPLRFLCLSPSVNRSFHSIS